MIASVGTAGSHLDYVLDHGLCAVEAGLVPPDYNLAIVADGNILIDLNVTTQAPMKIIDGDSLLTNHSAHVHPGKRKYVVLCNRSGISRSCSVLLLLLGYWLLPLFWYPWYHALAPKYPCAAAAYP